MQNGVVRCQNCGAECSFNDDYCRRCYMKIERNNGIESQSEEINGVPVSQWSNMLEKNSGRYLSIFRKNEHKRVFLHINWAAFFFTIYWFFYRKMYLYGILSLAVTLFISLFSLLTSSLILNDDIITIRELDNQIQEIEDAGNYNEYEDKFALELETKTVYDSYKLKSFAISITLFISLSFVSSLFFDCIYRYFLLHKGLYTGAGVSGISILAALAVVGIYNFISEFITVYFAGWVGSNLIG